MDAKQAQLETKLADLLQQTAQIASQLQAVEQGSGTPHFDQIEIPAHQTGQRLSQLIQSFRAADVVAEQHAQIDCPDCGRSCQIETRHRQVHSMDGPLELLETVAACRRCRRSFFPST